MNRYPDILEKFLVVLELVWNIPTPTAAVPLRLTAQCLSLCYSLNSSGYCLNLTDLTQKGLFKIDRDTAEIAFPDAAASLPGLAENHGGGDTTTSVKTDPRSLSPIEFQRRAKILGLHEKDSYSSSEYPRKTRRLLRRRRRKPATSKTRRWPQAQQGSKGQASAVMRSPRIIPMVR